MTLTGSGNTSFTVLLTISHNWIASVVIEAHSNWLFADEVDTSSWVLPDYDDSDWNVKHYGEFPPYNGRRFYRIHVSLDTRALEYSGSLLLGLRGRNDSSLYIDGDAVFEHLCPLSRPLTHRPTALDEDAFNGTETPYFQYTLPAHRLGASLVVAVQTDAAIAQSVPDVFDAVAVMLPRHASRLLDGVAKSAHAKDFYSNPLGQALDGNRQSAWRIAGSRADFAFTFSRGRFEYLNEYAITAAQLETARPVSWVVRGCLQSSEESCREVGCDVKLEESCDVKSEVGCETGCEASCDVLDVRQDVSWLGTSQTRRFAMNGRARAYRSYRIDFGGRGAQHSLVEATGAEMAIGEIAMGCSPQPAPAMLRYPVAAVEGWVDFPLSVAPVVNEYEDFAVVPALPAGLTLHPATGVLSGVLTQPFAGQFTVSARHRALRTVANTTLAVSVSGILSSPTSRVVCPETARLVRLKWASLQHSHLEAWELRHNGTVLAAGRGVDAGEDALVQSRVFCLPLGDYTLHQRVLASHAATRAGHLTLQLHAPVPCADSTGNGVNGGGDGGNGGGDNDDGDDGGGVNGGGGVNNGVNGGAGDARQSYDFHTLTVLPFAECDAAWSELPASPFTLRCDAFAFTTRLLLDANTQWHANTDDWVDKRWYSTHYDETPSWFVTTTASLPFFRSEARLRLWLSVDKAAAESYELLLRGSTRVSLFLNGYKLGSKEAPRRDSWFAYRLSADLLHDGTNLLALSFASDDGHGPCSDSPIAVLLQPVLARSAPLTYESLSIATSSPPIAGFPPQALFDSNPLSEWRGALENGRLQLTVELPPTTLFYLNEYCVVSSSTAPDYDPAGWSLKGRLASGWWVSLSAVSSVHFFQRGEKRCFPVLAQTPPLLSELQISFASFWREGFVQLSEILLNCVAFARVPLPPFEYRPCTLAVVKNVELARSDTPCAFYSAYTIEPSLPWGLAIDSGNGQVFGKLDKVLPDTTFTVHALSYAQEVRTTLTLQFRECEAPMSLLHLQLSDLDSTALLSFRLTAGPAGTSGATIASQQIPLASSSQDYFYCVASGAYSLQFHDRRNAGFLDTHFALAVDGVLVHAGYFNPGFSNIHVDFTTGFLLPRQTPWYYSLDGSTPPAQWFRTIDSVHETWEVAQPGAFPAPLARTQYFKTVMDLQTLPVALASQVAYVIEVNVKGGVCVYVDGKEVLRHRLPLGVLTPQTRPTASFPQTRSVFGSVSVQFAEWEEKVVVIAAEVHDADVQSTSDFWMRVRLVPDESQCEFEATVSSNKEAAISDLAAVFNNRYYDKMVVRDECEDVELFFDLEATSYQYVTELCLFTGNTAGEYPHALALDGGVVTGNTTVSGTVSGIANTVSGTAARTTTPTGEEVTWEELFAEEGLWFPKVAYGISQCFHFYNEKSYAHFRLRLRDCEHKDAMEVAEVEFFSRRLDGFCEDASSASRTRTPSGEWKGYACPALYWGRLLRYCENGTWSQEVNYCRPVSPTAFKYPAEMFMVRRKQFVSIVPTVVGKELLFAIDAVPKGMRFDNSTGELSGFYQEDRVMMKVEVTVVNPSGRQQTSFALYVVNHNEDLLLVIAGLAIACLLLLAVYIVIVMRRSSESVEREAERSHLHTKELPKNMLPLLV